MEGCRRFASIGRLCRRFRSPANLGESTRAAPAGLATQRVSAGSSDHVYGGFCSGLTNRKIVSAILQSDGQWRSSRRVARISSSWTATPRRSISMARLGSQAVAIGVPDNASFASGGKPETAAL